MKKNNNKIKKILTISILFSFVALFFIATNSYADSSLPKLEAPDLKVNIPGMNRLQDVDCQPNACSIPWLADYIIGIQKYAISLLGIIATVVVMFGGVIWLMSGGDSQKISEAKKFIISGITGLVLILCSYALLYIINPSLTLMGSINITRIEKIDLAEIAFDPAIADENINIPLGKFCGCFDWKSTKSTTTLNSAESINTAIKNMQSSSPINGMGDIVLEYANKYDIDPAIFLATAKMDSGMGTAGAGKKNKNLGNITCGASVCKEYSAGCNGRWQTASSWENAIKYYFCFMKNAKTMSGTTTLREMISTYAPPCELKGKCENNTSTYIDFVATIIDKYNPNATKSDGSTGKSCDCYNPCDRCKQAGVQCCSK